jgi:hypothetical protein
MYNKLLRKNLKKLVIGTLAFGSLLSLSSCSVCSYGTKFTSEWAKGNRLKNVYIIESSSAPEGFKTELMYNLRIDLAKYGVKNGGSCYDKTALDAESVLDKKVTDFNPDYVIYIRNTETLYRNKELLEKDVVFRYYSIKIEDLKNKAIAFKTTCVTGPVESEEMAKQLIKILKKEKFITTK